MTAGRAPVIVIGIGNPLRRDDGVGAAVVDAIGRADADRAVDDRCELRVITGETTGLLEAWDGRRLAIVIDATRGAGHPGTSHCIELGPGGLGQRRKSVASTHGVGLAVAVDLARTLGRLPDRLVVVGIEAADLGPGDGLSEPVAAAVPVVVDRVVDQLADELARCRSVRPLP